MRRIELTQAQKDIVLGKLENVQGCFDEYIEVSEEITVHAWGRFDIVGYVEDDYYNGTGGFVEEYREVDVTLEAFVGETCEHCEVGDEFSKECYELLQAA